MFHLCGALIWVFLAVPGCVRSQNVALTNSSVDIMALQEVDVPGEGTSSQIILDASSLGKGRQFYSKDSLTFQVGNQVKTFRRVLGDAANNNHFVGESATGDSLQLLRYASAKTGKEILIGSLVELDTKLVYQFKSEAYSSNSRSQVLMNAKVTPSHEFPLPDEPLELDAVTIKKMEEYHEKTLNANYSFKATIDEESSPTTVSSVKANSYSEDTDIISIMIVWTKQSECKYSNLTADCATTNETEDNMRALIDAGIAESNSVYNLSGIGVQLELVHAYRHPTYTESEAYKTDFLKVGAYGNTLARMAIPLDGILDDVQWKRHKYSADMVSMFIDDKTYCGVAFVGTGYFPIPSAPFMYSVVGYDCVLGAFALTHELGHNMGCEHDRGTDDTCGWQWLYYGHGWRDPGCNFRTIMAYPCQTGQCDESRCYSCPVIPRFSDAHDTYVGIPLGNWRNDCARHIRRTGPLIAQFYTNHICDQDQTLCQIRGILCFAPQMMAYVEDRGSVAMKDLQVGERVMTTGKDGNLKYETIYSINHFHRTQETVFLQIHTEGKAPLEISPQHMIFVQGKKHPISATDIKIGHNIQTLQSTESISYSRVTDIKSVRRRGFFNPLTTSGTIIVNDIQVSTYASIPSSLNMIASPFSTVDGCVQMWGTDIITHQRLIHIFLSPYRFLSLLNPFLSGRASHVWNLLEGEDRNEFLSWYTLMSLKLFNWWQQQHSFVQTVTFFILLIAFGIMNLVVSSTTTSSLTLVAIFLIPLIVLKLSKVFVDDDMANIMHPIGRGEVEKSARSVELKPALRRIRKCKL